MYKLYFRFRRFILMVQTKKVISMNYSSSTSCWKPWKWVRFYLIITMRDIYINSNLNPLTEFTGSSITTEFKYILPWNISQIITKTIPISTRIVISHAINQGILSCDYWKVSENWTTWSEFLNGQKAIAEHILASEEWKKSKREGLWESQSRDPSRKVNYLSKVLWDFRTEFLWKIITEFTRFVSSTRIG